MTDADTVLKAFLDDSMDRHLKAFVSLMQDFNATKNMSFWRMAYMEMDAADALAQRMYELGIRDSPVVLYPEGWDKKAELPAPVKVRG